MKIRYANLRIVMAVGLSIIAFLVFATRSWAADGATFITENYPDNTSVTGGTSFTKTWTIRNSGTTTWNSGYKLKWVSGSLSPSHSDIPISGTVAPGGSYIFSVSMRAPASQSSIQTCREDWKFTNSSGSTITVSGSSTIWALIKVPASITPPTSDDHGNTCSVATVISLNNGNGSINGSLTAGDIDYFKVQMSSARTLTVYTTGSTDTYGYLKDSNCNTITTNDDGTDRNFRISRSVTAGTYYVAIKHYSSSGTGNYTLNVQAGASPNPQPADDHGNTCSSASTLNVNSNINGNIGTAGDIDYFKIQVSSTGTLTVYTTGSTDTYGILKNSNCSDIASNDDSSDRNFRIIQSVTTGAYYVAVRHYSSSGTGTYTLYANFQAGDRPFPATVITTKTSTSSYAREKNAFYASDPALAGQCTWYTYGRVIELAESGYLKTSVKDRFYSAFWGKTGRDAKNWPDFLGGTWISTNTNPLPVDKRRKGLVAVWKGGTHGHVGFVEEVSADKTKYRLSDFNRSGDTTYRNQWYNFEGSSDLLLGGYPYFLELDLN